jgi:hypothetical protein
MITLARIVQAPPVSSWGTYHVAYTLVAAIYIGYSLSLWMRARRYRRAVDSARTPSRR